MIDSLNAKPPRGLIGCREPGLKQRGEFLLELLERQAETAGGHLRWNVARLNVETHVAAGYPEIPELPVQVASVATLVRRLDQLAPPDLIVPDECHHAAAPSWRRILDAYPEANVLGATATPQRLDGKGSTISSTR